MDTTLARNHVVMVTGGLGFIGSHLVNRLVACNDVSRILVIDSRAHPYGNLGEYILVKNPKIELHIVDVVDENRIFELARGCDLIYHLAAETHVQRSIDAPRPFVLSNVMGTFAVLEATRRHGCRLVYASTSEVYGDVPESEITEDHPLNAYSPYAATKLAADRLVLSYIHTYGIEASILRLFNTYGPGQHFEKVIPMFLCSALCDLPFPMQGDGSATRDWSYVEDVCARLTHLIESPLPSAVCNLASGESMTVYELAERIARLAGKPHLSVTRQAERPGHVSHQTADVNKTHQHFGSTAISLEDGLAKTYAWYEDRIDLWRPMFLQFRSYLISEMQPSEALMRCKAMAG
jgi:dTDP-glucose 4,6-dehydratase